VRRLIQVFALLLVILSGSLAGLRLPSPAEPCHCGMPMDTCPMKMPARSAPCGPGLALASLPAALCRLAQAPDVRKEPSPFPPAVWSAPRLLASGPSVLARPGPVPPLLTQARLSVFRI
jgi:hypothetical protein